MKKVLLLSATFFMFLFSVNAQVIYEDDFDSYTVGGYLAEQAAEWTTWSGAPGGDEDAEISDAQALSGANSVLVEDITDLVLPLGNKTSGRYEVSFYYYIPAGFAGYYNIQHFEQPGVEWAMECYFEDDGTGYVDAGGLNAASFNYTQDAWVEVVNIIDLNNDSAELYIEGSFVHGWQFSLQADGTPGEPQLGGMNHYAGANAGQTPMYYFDDYNYEQLPTVLFYDDFESYTVGGYLAEQSDWWTTWGGTVGTDEDALISDVQSNSPDQSVIIEGVSDLIGPFGNKTSGLYEVNFYYYVPSGFGGYYNIQHFETPGVEWAYELYFFELDEGRLTANGEDHSFTFSHDTWVYIENIINLDEDLASVYVDGVLVHEFPFSTQASGGPGELQLGGIDIYAGAEPGETPKFYVDDFEWVEITGSTEPQISVNPSSFTKVMNQGVIEDETLTIENVGAAELTFETDVVYNIGDNKTVAATEKNPVKTNYKKVFLNASSKPAKNMKSVSQPADDAFLQYYIGGPANSLGYIEAPGEFEVAAKFMNDELLQYAGMELVSADIHISDVPETTLFRVYGESDLPYVSGDLYEEQEFFPMPDDFNTVTLNDPITITGEDLWIGYYVSIVVNETFPASFDAGPVDPNGDWMRSGPAWGHLSDNANIEVPGNWIISAMLTGEPIEQWLSVTPDEGTVDPGMSEDLMVEFDASGLEMGSYSATIQVHNNDVANPTEYVNVSLAVLTGVNEHAENNAVMVYPNPARNYINVKANHQVDRIRILNYLGQVVYDNDRVDEISQINVSDFVNGVYIIQVDTPAGTSNSQVIIK